MVKLEEMAYLEFKAQWAQKVKLAFKDSLVHLETMVVMESKDPKETSDQLAEKDKKVKLVPVAILA